MSGSNKDIFRKKRRVQGSRGVTLIELAVAISMSAIVVGVVFYAWNTINIHIINNSRKAVFEVEARRIAGSIVSQIRRSPEVISWHSNGITYISPDAGDTVTYEFFNQELKRNDTMLVNIAQKARITDFRIEPEESGTPSEGHFDVLLHVMLSMEDDFDNRTDIRMDVAVKRPEEEDNKEGRDGWNF